MKKPSLTEQDDNNVTLTDAWVGTRISWIREAVALWMVSLLLQSSSAEKTKTPESVIWWANPDSEEFQKAALKMTKPDGTIDLEKWGFHIIDEDLEAIMEDPSRTPKIRGPYREI